MARNGYEPEGREFESLRAHHLAALVPRSRPQTGGHIFHSEPVDSALILPFDRQVNLSQGRQFLPTQDLDIVLVFNRLELELGVLNTMTDEVARNGVL